MTPTRSLAALATILALVAAPGTSPLAAQAVPTPESVLGFRVGADFRLATYEESIGYFQALDAASDRLELREVARTSGGRPWYVALISSPENLRDVERYREISRRLARVAGVDEEEARRLAREGKAIVHVDGGLHATEVAHAQHTMQLAHDLLAGAEDDPRTAAILDEVILMLWPSVNPDGQTMVVEWYRSNVGTPYEVAPVPFLYQAYVGHDNNRDAYMLNMRESRELARVWKAWEPQIVYVHHQSSPFPTRIWLPPFAEPIASRAPPIPSRNVNAIGMAIARMLESRGQPGATHMGTGFDAWYPGYVDYLPVFRNQAAFWTETALYRYATPHFYTIDDFPESRRGLRAESLYPSPWKGGWWRLRDAVDYMLTASYAVLDWAAKYKEDLLMDRWRSGRDVVERYRSEPPYAYVIPAAQRDPVAAAELVRRLAFNGLEVARLSADAELGGMAWSEGDWVIPMDQPFAELARQVLEVQEYPDLREYPEGPPEQPYDAAGWTLPLAMQVEVVGVDAPLDAAVRAALATLDGETVPWDSEADASPWDTPPAAGFDTDPVAAGVVPPEGRIAGSGPAVVVDPGQVNGFRFLNRAFEAGARVRFDPAAGGTYRVSGIGGDAAGRWTRELRLRAARSAARGEEVARPRLALYRPWTASMDEGWTRWLLERYGFEFTSLRPGDVHAGGLADRYDVILLPGDRRGDLVEGWEDGSVPPRYERGLEEEGLRELDAFVRAGGTLVCPSAAAPTCIDGLHLPVEDVTDGLGRHDFYSSGSLLEVRTDPAHPVMAGMPARAPVFFDRSPVFTTLEGFRGRALAAYAEEGSPLLSGYLLGEEHLQGLAAALDVEHGDGHVVLLGFRPQWRGQPFGTFRVLFNAALFHGAHAAGDPGTPGFWSPPARDGESGDAPGGR